MSSGDRELYEFSDFRLDVSERLLLHKGKRVQLSEKAFETLCALVRRAGSLVSKDELMQTVWADAIVEENNLDKNISLLRQALGEQRRGKTKFIETVRGHGYRFVAEIQRIEIDGGASARRTRIEADDGGEKNFSRPLARARFSDADVNAQRAGSNVVALARWQHEKAHSKSSQFVGDAATSSKAELKSEERDRSVPQIKFKNHRLTALTAGIALIVLAGIIFASYMFNAPTANNFESWEIKRSIDAQQASIDANSPSQTNLYLQMSEIEQFDFIRERIKQIENLIEAVPTNLSDDDVRAIKIEIDDYVEEIDSLSQVPFEEGLRVIYGRASQYVPIVRRSFEARRVPPVLGIYQAMVESEYHDCISFHSNPMMAPVGLFQFNRKTAARYGLTPKDYCNVEKQCDAAARLMSDLISDFDDKTLALLAFNVGEKGLRNHLRQLRERSINERNAWVVRRNFRDFKAPSDEMPFNQEHEGFYYVPKFFAAAIIGENPQTFNLATPPLSALR